MTHHYNYNWSKLVFTLIALVLLLGFLILNGTLLSVSSIIIFVIVTSYTIFMRVSSLLKVTLSDTQIIIHSPMPFQKVRRIPFSDIKAYNELKIGNRESRPPYGGRLTPKEGSPILFMADGTSSFDELSKKLSILFPSLPLETTQHIDSIDT